MMKSDRGLVSILIGTYNRANLLVRCIDSIFEQSTKNIEVVVVNDASTDNTQQALKLLKKKYGERFKYLSNTVNKGIAYNSNLAFKHSSGDYLALIGDDDYWIDDEKLEKQLMILKENENIGVVGTWWIEKSDEKEIKKDPDEPKNWKSKLLAGGGVICGSTPLIPRDVWIDVGGFDENLKRGTDSDLFRRIVLNDYYANVINDYTTIVDVGHGYQRITPIESKERLKILITANIYILKKYFGKFVKHPRAMYKRSFKLFKYLIKYYIKWW